MTISPAEEYFLCLFIVALVIATSICSYWNGYSGGNFDGYIRGIKKGEEIWGRNPDED